MNVLTVGEIVVLGRDRCGGVHAALDGLHGIEAGSRLAGWLSLVVPAVRRTRASGADGAALLARSVEEHVRTWMVNLLTFGCVDRAVAAGRIRIHGWVYDLTDATLRVWRDELDGFVPAGESHAGPAAD